MRELKFRAWDSTYNKMLFFDGIFNRAPYTEKSTFPQYESCPEAHDLKVMQFTGLQDKNGKDIYEGDVLIIMGPSLEALDEWQNNDNDLRDPQELPKIIIKTDVATMEGFPTYWLKDEEFGYEGEGLQTPSEWEIIGNIYENKNLLQPCDICGESGELVNGVCAKPECRKATSSQDV